MSAPPAPNPANPRVKIATSAGDITLELFKDKVPTTVENFLSYVNDGHYEGTIFHRVIQGFMIQGGGYEPSMRQKRTKSPIRLEIHKELRHWDGALAMARTSDPHSASAQFYICHGPQKGLDDNYAVFGVVRQGIDVVKRIATTPTDRADKPKTDVVIQKASLV